MTWSFSLRCKDSELDNKIKEAIRNEGASKENPASARALRQVQDHVIGALHSMPKDAMIVVQCYGHYDASGEGGHELRIQVETAAAIAAKEQRESEEQRRVRENDEIAAAKVRQEAEDAEAERIRLVNESYGHSEQQEKPPAAIPQVSGVDQDAPE